VNACGPSFLPCSRPGWHSARVAPGPAGAFTLLELLVVIAVIGVLAALLVPAVGAARRSAQAARTRIQLAQWAAAIESFRSEYGHYPVFDASGLVNAGAAAAPESEHLFHDLLAGRRRDGSALPPADVPGISAAAQNRKRLRFHSFGEAELTPASAAIPHLLCDASGGTAIAVLVDRDLDGLIRIGAGGDYAAAPAVGGMAPDSSDLPSPGLRAGVALYAPAPGAGPQNRRFVCSWK